MSPPVCLSCVKGTGMDLIEIHHHETKLFPFNKKIRGSKMMDGLHACHHEVDSLIVVA